jgi:hypothetical protein
MFCPSLFIFAFIFCLKQQVPIPVFTPLWSGLKENRKKNSMVGGWELPYLIIFHPANLLYVLHILFCFCTELGPKFWKNKGMVYLHPK